MVKAPARRLTWISAISGNVVSLLPFFLGSFVSFPTAFTATAMKFFFFFPVGLERCYEFPLFYFFFFFNCKIIQFCFGLYIWDHSTIGSACIGISVVIENKLSDPRKNKNWVWITRRPDGMRLGITEIEDGVYRHAINQSSFFFVRTPNPTKVLASLPMECCSINNDFDLQSSNFKFELSWD